MSRVSASIVHPLWPNNRDQKQELEYEIKMPVIKQLHDFPLGPLSSRREIEEQKTDFAVL